MRCVFISGLLVLACVGGLTAAEPLAGVPPYKKGDRLRPRPPVVTPPTASTQDNPGRAPSDAIVLFDGRDLSQWMEFNARTGIDDPSLPPKWRVQDGYAEAAGNNIQTRAKFGDCHFHVEWRTSPEEAAIGGLRFDQHLGNSGIEFGDHPEIQILDSYRNDTYPDGQAASIYGYYPPRVNASRPPGEWQSYDIFYTAPVFENGRKVKSATYTVLHNGLPVQLAVEVKGEAVECRIKFRPHGGQLRYRNIWVRPLHAYDEAAGQPLPPGARTTNPFPRPPAAPKSPVPAKTAK
jgi:hypothetical protein